MRENSNWENWCLGPFFFVIYLASVSAIILQIQWSDNEVTSGSMSINSVISIDDFPFNFAVAVPPGNCSVWNGSGNACQIDGVLIPTPLVFHWLLLKSWWEFNLEKNQWNSEFCQKIEFLWFYFFRNTWIFASKSENIKNYLKWQ